MSKIQWTEKTWNPIVGCRRVSPGCENCYAEKQVHRGMAPQHKGLTVVGKGGKGPRWNGAYNVAEKRLDEPLRRKVPTRWFVNSLSDLFFEPLPFELIAALFGVMAAAPQHTFQVLTKRPERALEFFRWYEGTSGAGAHAYAAIVEGHDRIVPPGDRTSNVARAFDAARRDPPPWPLPNVWLGVSVEDQATADERIPKLLELPAAVRWVSYEPALGPVDFDPWMSLGRPCSAEHPCSVCAGGGEACDRLDWIVVGGESGPGARPFDLAWARSVVRDCATTGVPVFVKQLGARPVVRMTARYPQLPAKLVDRKGGDPSEWPADLRVREELDR